MKNIQMHNTNRVRAVTDAANVGLDDHGPALVRVFEMLWADNDSSIEEVHYAAGRIHFLAKIGFLMYDVGYIAGRKRDGEFPTFPTGKAAEIVGVESWEAVSPAQRDFLLYSFWRGVDEGQLQAEKQ